MNVEKRKFTKANTNIVKSALHEFEKCISVLLVTTDTNVVVVFLMTSANWLLIDS